MKKTFTLFLLSLLAFFNVNAQMLDPIKWDVKLNKSGKTEGSVVFTAKIASGWHLYATQMPEGGPNPTVFKWETLENVELVGAIKPDRAPHQEYDAIYELTLGWWVNSVTFTQKVKFKDPSNFKIEGYISYMGCNDQTCINPVPYDFKFAESNPAAAAAPVKEDPAKVAEEKAETEVTAATPADTAATQAAEAAPAPAVQDNGLVNATWNPVDTTAAGSAEEKTESSLLYIFIAGFLGGLVSLLTPCVWPMIPLTVSFFLKKHGSRRRSIIDAVIYGLSIIVIYLILGLFITMVFGPSKLNDLATNAVFNIIFFVLLVVFAISFFGAFEITLPDKWANKMDNKAERTSGLLSIFFMAFTLTLVSFSCTGPIIGTLLVEAVSLGDFTGPAVGMGGYALALAIPFTVFAIFPSWLQGLPKSGGWLNSVKVVLGFIELALSLKFLSVADLAYNWGILDREVFIALWVVMFTLLGVYLLGKIRFPHDSKTESVGVFRFFLALISLSFAVYLVPGLWGAPLKSVSAFVPPLYTQDLNLYESGKFVHYDDYNEGMAAAKKMGKPVFLDFSGYGCVNCRKMEAAVIDTDEIQKKIEENFVMITLMVDDKKDLEKPIVVQENGKEVKLRTYGDLWSYLQRYKFGANSQPYYVVLDNEGNMLSGPAYYDENISKFDNFLQKGIDGYKK